MKKRLLLPADRTPPPCSARIVRLRAQEPTIPIIVKDTTSFYWQIVLAGARKAGRTCM